MNNEKKKIITFWENISRNKWLFIRLTTIFLLLIVFSVSLLIFLKYAWKTELSEEAVNTKNTKVQVEKLQEITEILEEKKAQINTSSLPKFSDPFKKQPQATETESSKSETETGL